MWQHVRVDTVMLVTSYSPGPGAGALYTGLCTSSSVAESRQMISIETSISETFTQTETSETSEDVFSQHFETDIQKLETEAPSQTLETGEDSQIPQSLSSAVLPHHHQPTGELETRLVKEYTIGKPCGAFRTVLTNQETNIISGQLIMRYFLSSCLDHCQHQQRY